MRLSNCVAKRRNEKSKKEKTRSLNDLGDERLHHLQSILLSRVAIIIHCIIIGFFDTKQN